MRIISQTDIQEAKFIASQFISYLESIGMGSSELAKSLKLFQWSYVWYFL